MPEAVELYCTETGSGSPIILLHGLFGNHFNLNVVAKGLSDSYHVLMPDLRNHGRSPHDDVMDYPALAADIIALLDKHDLDSAALVGHSLGGKVAMVSALLYPDRVSRMAALDIAPVRYERSTNDIIQHMLDLPVTEIGSRTEADQRLADKIPDDQVRNFLLQNLATGKSGGFRWRINLNAIKAYRSDLGGFPDLSKSYTGPALFLHGAESSYVHPEHHAAILQYFPNAQIEPVAGAGHWLHIDRRNAVVNTLLDFLAA